MSRSLDIGPYEGRSDRPLWLVAAVITAILAGLAIGSANSYVSIVVAQATVSFCSPLANGSRTVPRRPG